MPRPFKSVKSDIMLVPDRNVAVVTPKGVVEIPASEVTAAGVGQKAVGLLTIPANWTLPFYVVLDGALASGNSIGELTSNVCEAAARSGVTSSRQIVRSNGIDEGLSQRGALNSRSCSPESVVGTLLSLSEEVHKTTKGITHWIIQNEVIALVKGQLSNERRIRYEKRDWTIEIEPADGKGADQVPIGIRKWREGETLPDASLRCESGLKISLTLRQVAMWAHRDSRRFLLEWVWDGTTVYVVQLDVATDTGGENPKSLLPAHVRPISIQQLKCFSEASAKHKVQLRKLANAAMYEQLGYLMPPFFVLDKHEELKRILDGEGPSDSLLGDLEVLTRRPLVLRTDGVDLPPEKCEMLPRSEELRTPEAAVRWLQESFGPTVRQLGIENQSIALIGHHFIPSVASAWAGAEPGRRWVRIEALWGIPESLYWHSHDTYEVDTEKADLNLPFPGTCPYSVRSRKRFKGTFIAPDESGAWVHHQTKMPYDWSPTITSNQWLFEIAHTTRRICERVGKPVQVMWFVDNHAEATPHHVLPWYHSSFEGIEAPIRAPRKKIRTSQEHCIHNEHDWAGLKELILAGTKIERVTVEPYDPNLVRNPNFAEELGSLARENNFVVVLAGGMLAHAYHALRRAGAAVECVDLFGANEERAEYNKVVRDKVPAQISDRGEFYEIVRLRGDALIAALCRKLVEEALEALDATTGTDLIAELADVQEVVIAIANAIQVNANQLEDERLHKLRRRGGFEKGYMLLTTASPYSITRQQTSEKLIEAQNPDEIRTISNPTQIPQKAVYRRPDHRNLTDGTEELLVFETELHRLGKIIESIDFELPPNVDSRRYTSCIEISRTGGELRATVRLQARRKKGESGGQKALDFESEKER